MTYHKNSLADNTPSTSTEEEGGYVHYQEKVDGRKIAARSDSFKDHFSQAKLFWNSMTIVEKKHIIDAFSFEVGKVKNKDIRQQVVDMFGHVDNGLASAVAHAVGVHAPSASEESTVTKRSPALSQENKVKLPETRHIGILIGNQFDDAEVETIVEACLEAGMNVDLVSERYGTVTGSNGLAAEVDETFLTMHSVLYDAIVVAGGDAENPQKFKTDTIDFLNEAYKHFKPIGILSKGQVFVEDSNVEMTAGIILSTSNDFAQQFVDTVAQHRHWDR